MTRSIEMVNRSLLTCNMGYVERTSGCGVLACTSAMSTSVYVVGREVGRWVTEVIKLFRRLQFADCDGRYGW